MKKVLLALGLLFAGLLQAADTPFNTFVTGLGSATTPAGTELLPVVQGGTTKSLTPTQIKTYTLTSFVGGASGQYLQKNSSSDFDVSWAGPALTAVAGSGITLDTSTTPGSAIIANQLDSSTWAARGSGTFTGQLRIITDGAIINTVASPIVVRWNGTYWKVLGLTTVYFDSSQTNGTTAGTLQIPKQVSLQAGLVRAGTYVRTKVLFAKSATTDAVSASSIKVGTLCTTTDANMNAATQANTVRAYGISVSVIFGTTTVTQIGSPNAVNDGFAGSSATVAAHSVSNTISNIDTNPVCISPAIQLGGTTDTPQVWDVIVEIIP